MSKPVYYLVNRTDPDAGCFGPNGDLEELFDELREFGDDNSFEEEEYDNYDVAVYLGKVKSNTRVSLEMIVDEDKPRTRNAKDGV